MTTKVAVIQKPPVLLDRDKTIARAVESIDEAARAGAALLVFPEAYNGETCLVTLRHIAREAGCWVIGTATALQGSDIPADFPERDKLYKSDEWINNGDAVVINPAGAVTAGPLHREKSVLYAEIDREAARRARRSLDVCGHYGRPDIFSLAVNRKPLYPVEFSD